MPAPLKSVLLSLKPVALTAVIDEIELVPDLIAMEMLCSGGCPEVGVHNGVLCILGLQWRCTQPWMGNHNHASTTITPQTACECIPIALVVSLQNGLKCRVLTSILRGVPSATATSTARHLAAQRTTNG